MNLFWMIADIQTAEMLDLPTPELEGGKPHVVQTECSPFQQKIIQTYVKRSEDIRAGRVKPEKDNMLKLTHEARLLAIDPRLLYPNAPNYPDSKLNTCIRNVYDIWQETAESRATQVVFCDVGTPKRGQFNVYDEVRSVLQDFSSIDWNAEVDDSAAMEILDRVFKQYFDDAPKQPGQEETDEADPQKGAGIAAAEAIRGELSGHGISAEEIEKMGIAAAETARDELIRKGVPAKEIAFIHDCHTDAQRETLFEKVRSGEIRVLLGSTEKLGMGTNIQDRLIAIHNLDCPWRPMDIIQRIGRGKRQGNMHPVIRIFNYVTSGTFDSYLWQIQEQKLRFITQVMSGKSISRTCEDVDITVLNAAEIKAIATNNPLLLEKMTAENEVTRLTILRNAWQNERLLLERSIERDYPQKIRELEGAIAVTRKDIETVKAHPSKGDAFRITLDGREYDERAKAGNALTLQAKLLSQRKDSRGEQKIGAFRGLELTLKHSYGTVYLEATGAGYYTAEMADSEIGNITRLENLLNSLRDRLTKQETDKGNMGTQLETAKAQVLQPFVHETELAGHSQRLMEINTKLEFKELADKDAVLEDEQDSGESVSAMQPEPAIIRG